jgi:hypothetical protein
MCLVVAIAIFFTAYLAVMFNRRAKADLEATLTPLAELLGGEIDLEEAKATGRYRGHIAEGRAANSPDGPGKIFYALVIDGAGGDKWTYTLRKPKEPEAALISKWDGASDERGRALEEQVGAILNPVLTAPGWIRVEYDPAPGHIRLSRQMVTRRDIPGVDAFTRQLDLVVEIAAVNRSLQAA